MRLPVYFLMVLAILGDAQGSWARGSDPREKCERIFAFYTGIKIENVIRISSEQELTAGLSSSYFYVVLGRQTNFPRVSDDEKAACEIVAAEYLKGLEDYLKARFTYVLNGGDLTKAYAEMKMFLAPFFESQKTAVLARFSEIADRYSENLKVKLFSELLGSPWEKYIGTQMELVPWSEEWSSAVGSELCAAVDLKTRRIAIQPFCAETEIMKIRLFHEIAHLWDESPLVSEGKANELPAWTETLRFLEWSRLHGKTIPEYFVSIEKTIEEIGLKSWADLLPHSKDPASF